MSFEFNFQVRDRLYEIIPTDDLNKLQLISDSPNQVHSKEVIIDIIVYCSLGDFNQAKLNCDETISFLNASRRAFIVQRLLWNYWRRCFIKTKLALDKKPEEIENCSNYYLVIKNYKDLMTNFNGFDWTWYQHFVLEIRRLKEESDTLNDDLQS